MAKVKILGLNNVKTNIIKLFNEVKSDEKLLLDVGNETVKLTKSFLRSGKSPGSKQPLPELSKAWEQRKLELTATNHPSKYYVDGLSNLTFTGQLLESIQVVRIDKKNASAIIEVTDNAARKPYKNLNNKPVKNTPKNSQIYKWLTARGWDFFGINRQMENVINKIVRKYLNERIKKNFNKK